MRVLNAAGIKTIGDLAIAPVGLLEKVFGKVGGYLHLYANGDESSSVAHKDYIEPVKSVGRNMTTYRDMINFDDIWREIYMLSDSVASTLREKRLKCRTVKVSIREFDLKFCVRQGKLENPSYLTKDIADKAMNVFHTRYTFSKPLRSIGVRGDDVVPDNVLIQTNLFHDFRQDDKTESLERAMDNIRYRYGYEAIQWATVLLDKKLTYVPPDYNRSEYRINNFAAK